jgi:hypothetical protein
MRFEGLNSGKGVNGVAISCSNCAEIEIKDSVFKDLKAEQGAALYLTETDSAKAWTGKSAKYRIEGTLFENCVSFKGGAILADNPQSLNLKGSTFNSNSAFQTNIFTNSG